MTWKEKLLSNLLLRNMASDLISYPVSAAKNTFIPYFQYKVGVYQRDYYLYFTSPPNSVRYSNDIFNKRDRDKRDKDYGKEKDKDYDKDRDRDYDRDRDKGRDGNGRVYSFNELDIPRGHLPPPGECKVWIPGKPAGQQGPPQSCSSASRNAPSDAWVITHEGSRYRVNIFNRTRRSVVDEVRYYEISE